MKMLAGEDEREEEDGQQAQRANQHSAQIHICNVNTKRHQGAGFIKKKKEKKQKTGHGFKLYLQTSATRPGRVRPHLFCGLVQELMEKST